jgi:biotin operon repressor
MVSSRAARSKEDPAPPIDPALQSKLTAKFGPKLMRLGFTALPVLVQRHYRYVPGNPLPREVVDEETGEVFVIEETSYMTPTEYVIMTAIWSFWWSNQSDPWPSVEQIRSQVGKSERQVRRYLQRLRDKGFMLSVEQYNGEGKQISNRYDFTPFFKRLIAYLDEMEQPVKSGHSPSRDDKSDGETMSNEAGSGCQKDQRNQIESDSDSLNVDTSDSSGSAASSKGTVLSPPAACSRIAQGTIRNTEEETEATARVESDRTSNLPSASRELAAGGRSKDVEGNNPGKKASKYEEFVLASGVPLEQLTALETWLQQCPRPGQTPLLVQVTIDPISQQFDNARLMVSNRTQATKLYQYARLQGMQQEELDIVFRDWVHAAKIHVPPHVTKKMAWFFRALKVELLKGLMFMERPPAPPVGASLAEEEAVAPVVESCHDSYQPTREIVLLPGDDPDLGWPTPDHAEYFARRLCGDIGAERYEYEILPTQHRRWGVEFRRRSDHQVEDIFLSKQEMYAFRSKVRARDALLQVLAARIDSSQT